MRAGNGPHFFILISYSYTYVSRNFKVPSTGVQIGRASCRERV